jgi:putative RecB family exonuclease
VGLTRSYSQLALYRTCPEQYRLKYIERLPEDPAVWSIAGTTFHSFAELYLGGDLGVQPTPERVRNVWDVYWQVAERDVRERDGRDLGPVESWRKAARGKEDVGWWMVNGPQMCLDFVDWRLGVARDLQVLNLDDQLLLEARIETEFDGVPVVAIPDAVVVDEHGQANILDYKSGRRPPKDSLQLHVYSTALREQFGIEATWGLYYMTRVQQALPFHLSKWTPEQIRQMFVDLQAGIDDGTFTPTPGPDCKLCPFKANGCRYYNPESP